MTSFLASIVLAFGVVGVVGVPPSPPPTVGGVGVAPPPAWVEAGARSRWATYGSYCWSALGKPAACVDMIPPATRPDIARLPARPGSLVRLHLRFKPRSVQLYRIDPASRRLDAAVTGRTVSWQARAGLYDVEVKGPGGSASYVIRLASAN